jgi:hypothetical protein
VIPACTPAQRPDPNAQCSTGPITFWTPGGRTVYDAMLLKFDKRFSKRYMFTVSYALQDRKTVAGIVNLDNWFESYSSVGPRHVLNVSGIVDLPWGFQLGVISTSNSRSPVMPFIPSVDLDGDGTGGTPIPGAGFNCFNRGCGKSELAAAVQAWNRRYYPNGPPNPAGGIPFVQDARRQNIPFLVLPQNYQFGDSFHSQDVRLTKTFVFRERYKLNVFAEMFNVLNVANLSGFNFNLDSRNPNPAAQTFSFGQPTQRATQVFGSGGPRALQLAARFTF